MRDALSGLRMAIGLAALVAGCRKPAPKPDCLADLESPLHVESAEKACKTDDAMCRFSCSAGNRDACLNVAFAVQKRDRNGTESDSLFEKACAFGSAVGCTNYAAAIWARKSERPPLACARRLFEKACAAKEKFACGMVGRLLAEAGDIDGGLAALERSCDALGGFPCRVLASALEKSGRKGPPTKDLLARACKGGDSDACGVHENASETFHTPPPQ